MTVEAPIHLRLAAQQALLGHVTPNLRAFSVEEDGKTIRGLAVFEQPPSDHEIELIQLAGTELISHYVDSMIDDRIEVTSAPRPPLLAHLVYRRYEPGDGI
ncbi:hypothetical protein KOAAANKH_01716 [Brevundimonas sp. NIBR10]|uniref:hypothetical protein n=1 Tax=Brevundimonas sp. NIBR10 TaxID=3015997 RepID=UPI0022F1B372|nr:hypothetical protein [Brevundimonas sp. NIBR10]WGM46842.1 hypothetical protein KOAAANKH_01716 [Brevundimonas sp. NIBR10]